MNALYERKSFIPVVAMMLCCLMLCCLFTGTVMLGTMDVAYCEESDTAGEAANAIEQAVTTTATQIYKTMRAIITPLVICSFAYAGFLFFLGGSQGTEKARKVAVTSLIGLVFVIFAPEIGQAIATWFKGSGGDDLSNFNPYA